MTLYTLTHNLNEPVVSKNVMLYASGFSGHYFI